MTFLSFAQNREDVVLWRALRDVGQGRYIDVGAADPTNDSVTRAFYDRGWRGINIEPEREFYTHLAAERPEDVNLQAGLSSEQGEAELFLVGSRSGLSTFDAGIADVHTEAGFASKRIKVPLRTLAQVCEEHVRGPVHFLKIDVEGSEYAVIRGADFTRWRPWVVLVEATFPNSDRPTHAAWEPLLIEAGYRFTLFDGLNRFYVASEHGDRLHQRLSYAACVLDSYTTHREDALGRRAADLERELKDREAETAHHIDQLRADVAAGQQDLAERTAELDGLRKQSAQHELAILDRDRTIGTLNAEVVKRDATIGTLNAQMAERIATIEKLSAGITDLTRRLADSDRQIAQRNLEIADRDVAIAKLRHEADRLDAEWRAANSRLAELHASTSWRVTAPLRKLKTAWRD